MDWQLELSSLWTGSWTRSSLWTGLWTGSPLCGLAVGLSNCPLCGLVVGMSPMWTGSWIESLSSLVDW